MRTIRTRRLVALISGSALLASLAATTVAGPVGAADEVKCKGKVATIVGTQGPDVLVGTNGRDIIAGLGGNDVIKGLGGPDLICAGDGADRVKGNQGRDRLYGNAGPDKLFGGKGPDTLEGGVSDDMLKGQKGADALDGGPGTDTCYQDQGSESETSCELPAPPVVVPPAPGDKDGDGITDDVDACPNDGDAGYGVDGTGCPNLVADLSVEVTGVPGIPYEVPLTYAVTVTNHGPAATTYDLSPALTYDSLFRGSCSVITEPSGAQTSLGPGAAKAFGYRYDCFGSSLIARLTVSVTALGGTVDPAAANNSDYHVTTVS